MPTARLPHRSSRFTRPAAADAPLSDLNITPLIDVMLVLLVMFIITIPLQTHKVAIDLPTGDGPVAVPTVHRIAIAADGAVRWDGATLAPATLATRLKTLAADPNQSLILDADGEARYDVFDHTLATIRRAGVTRLGFADNSRFERP